MLAYGIFVQAISKALKHRKTAHNLVRHSDQGVQGEFN